MIIPADVDSVRSDVAINLLKLPTPSPVCLAVQLLRLDGCAELLKRLDLRLGRSLTYPSAARYLSQTAQAMSQPYRLTACPVGLTISHITAARHLPHCHIPRPSAVLNSTQHISGFTSLGNLRTQSLATLQLTVVR